MREAAQVHAKATLVELGAAHDRINWSYLSERTVRNSVLLSQRAQQLISSRENEVRRRAGRWAYAAARVFEDLSVLQEKIGRDWALLVSAINYDLAGYQANAACLAREVLRSDSGPLEALCALFLERKLLRVELQAPRLLAEPDSSDQEAYSERLGVALVAQGLLDSSRYLRSGSAEHLDAALKGLSLAENAASRFGLVRESNLAAALSSALPAIAARSTWSLMGDLVQNPTWRRYLIVLGRGLAPRVVDSRAVTEFWPSQVAALDRGLLDPDQDLVVKMPTSSGKTRVAELAIVSALISRPSYKCLYVAPYKALVSEVQDSFGMLFGDLGFAASTVIGALEDDEYDEVVVDEDEVLVMTPEKLDLLLRVNPSLLDRVGLVVLDEGHIVGEGERGVKYELLVSRLRRRLPEARFLALSAVVADETLAELAQWLGRDASANTVQSAWRPSAQRFAELTWTGTRGTLEYSLGQFDLQEAGFVPNVVVQQEFEVLNRDTGRYNRHRFPDSSNRAQVVAALVFELVRQGSVLVFAGQTDWARAVGSALNARIELAIATGGELPASFQRVTAPRSYAVASEWLGKDHPVTELLAKGIAIHHGRLPEAVRQAIEEDVRQRRIEVVVATSTLAQGVNLPVRYVVFHSWRRFDEQSERMAGLSAREYWNIAGRAGRAGQETEGTVIHLSTSREDSRAFRYYLEHRDRVEPVDSALLTLMQELVNGRISEGEVRAQLDSEILAMLLEEGAAEEIAASVSDTISGSLCSIQAERVGLPVEYAVDTVRTAAIELMTSVTSLQERTLFSSTGLASYSCLTLVEYIDAHRDEITVMMGAESLEDALSLADIAMTALIPLREMQTRRGFGGSLTELLSVWVRGIPLAEIAASVGASEVEALAQFVEDTFAYRIPWGLSGFLQLAESRLEIEASSLVRSLPSLVKYGVPSPEAAWAMSAGVASRSVAVKVAGEFSRTGVGGNPSLFRTWFGSLDIERLAEQLGVSDVELETTAAAVMRSRKSAYVEVLNRGELLPCTTEVTLRRRVIEAGTRRRLKSGDRVEIARDYDSNINRNSLMVRAGSEDLGYLTWELALALAPEVDAGNSVGGIIDSVSESTISLQLNWLPREA
jgi:replicative superfamily II helicase